MTCGFKPGYTIYCRAYKHVIEQEIALANIQEGDVVLNIGCGSLPFTSIHIAQMTNAKVIGIDRDVEAVKNAKEITKKFGVDDRVQIIHGDGEEDLGMDFEVAIVALQAGAKERIYKRLMEQGGEGCRVVFRQPREKFESVYGSLPDSLIPTSKAVHPMKAFKESFLFRGVEKKEGSA